MAALISRAIALCGTEEPDAPSRMLRAGPLSAELENGNLRYVKLGQLEVLRGIAFLVRDENWGTFTPRIDGLGIEEGADRFRVTYRGICADAKRRLVYNAEITGSADGSLVFAAAVTAETDVETNRTGFVVLHPLAGVAGRPARVTHTDGTTETTHFPALIKPSQPVFDIRSLSHEIAPGAWATCTMEGDAFEMEDQRNWSDASYKTYIRPLSKPWPYTLAKGSRHEQKVSLSIEGWPAVTPAAAEPHSVAVALGDDTGGHLPAIGIGVPGEEAEHALAALDLVRRLGPRHLICHIDARRPLGEAALEVYRRLSEGTRAELGLEIVIPGNGDPKAELSPVAAAVGEAGLAPSSVTVSPASDLLSHQPGHEDPSVPPAADILAAARAAFPGARIGGGVLAYFTELNRKRPPVGHFDFITHTTCPIVHAADDRSVMETLEALPAIIASTKAFAGGAAYRIGPSAIGCRQNPYGRAPLENPKGGRVCLARVDPRQRGLLNAAWTLAYVTAAAQGGIEALSMGAPTGPFGFVYRRTPEAQPYFDVLAGPAVYPAFHIMADLAGHSGRPLVAATTTHPREVAALAYRNSETLVLWLANLTAERLTIGLGGEIGNGRVAVLDAASFETAATDPAALDALARPLSGGGIDLDAYAVARIETAH